MQYFRVLVRAWLVRGPESSKTLKAQDYATHDALRSSTPRPHGGGIAAGRDKIANALARRAPETGYFFNGNQRKDNGKMNENETVDEIIAEMERESAQMFPALPIAVLQLASRFKAAIARERAARGGVK